MRNWGNSMRSAMGLIISLPLLVAPWAAGLSVSGSAQAAQMGPTDVVHLLSKSKTVNGKCRHVTSAEHEELGDYLAKAEIAAANRQGSDAASAAVKSGAAKGKTMECGEESKAMVNGTLDAARRAMAAAKASDRKRARKKKRVVSSRQSSSSSRGTLIPNRDYRVGQGRGLERYSHQASAYYVEHRCRHLNQHQAVRFWKRIVSNHQQLIASHGPGKVARAKSRAIALANKAGRCGTRTAMYVRDGYSDTMSN